MGPAALRWGGAAFGAVLIGFGAVIALETAGMRTAPSYARFGPRIFPFMVAAGLGLLGLTLAVAALRGPAPSGEQPVERLHVPALLWVMGGLVAEAVLLRPAGFVIAAAVLFASVARAFDSRRPVRDLAIGLWLGGVCHAGFTWGLGLRLPAGLWIDWLA